MTSFRTGQKELAVVSFHPLFHAARNIICAGRDPDSSDLEAICKAKAVILPQGCSPQLYEMARVNCRNVFPNYDVRFHYGGKLGQIKLFRETATSHPETELFHSVAEFNGRFPKIRGLHFPMVFKFDWGGEGDTVFLVPSSEELEKRVVHAARCEATGQKGFLLQRYVFSGNRSLRVVVIGNEMISYWRNQEDPTCFHASVSKGAKVDSTSHPDLIEAAELAVSTLCSRVGINLAGFDVIFSLNAVEPRPLLLEINYFFGRVGLGGSEGFYRILRKEIVRWLKQINI